MKIIKVNIIRRASTLGAFLCLIVTMFSAAAQERTFKTSPFYLFGLEENLTASVTAADIDDDGDVDIIASNGRHWAQQDYIYFNLGNGKLAERVPLGARQRTSYLSLLQITQTGKAQIITIHDYFPPSLYGIDASSKFVENAVLDKGGRSRGGALAEVTGDNIADLIVVRRGETDLLYKGSKNGFEAAIELGDLGSHSTGIAVGDVDGDNDLDIVIAHRHNQPSTLFLNRGNGEFIEVLLPDSDRDTRAVAISDINQDKIPDIVLGVVGKPNMILLGSPEGEYRLGAQWGNEKGRTFAIAIADLNKDGLPDIVEGNDEQVNNVYFNLGNLNFSSSSLSDEKLETYGVTIADMNGDSYYDIVIANSGAMNEVYINASR